jgi:carbonic anhydrase
MPFPQRLIDGYNAFRTGRLPAEQSRYRELAESGQSPRVMVIGCSGELFIVRNVANLVPPYAPDEAYHGVSAALEFAIAVLKVEHIVVLGHAQCGGVRAFVEQTPVSKTDFIGRWMSLMAPAVDKVGSAATTTPDYLERMEKASIANSIDNLMTFPALRASVACGAITVHGAYFGVATGQLSVRDPKTGEFVAVDKSLGSGHR